MKKGLLGSTALVGATALMAGAAGPAEAPTWKLTGNANFQFYYVDADNQGVTGTKSTIFFGPTGSTSTLKFALSVWDTTAKDQDHGWYFGVDEAECVRAPVFLGVCQDNLRAQAYAQEGRTPGDDIADGVCEPKLPEVAHRRAGSSHAGEDDPVGG